jgi:hypothetical protein
MDEGQAQIYQAPVVPEPKHSKPIAAIVLSFLLVLSVATVGYLYMSWQNTKDDLKASQAQLSEKNAELQKATAQLIPLRDVTRKTDVASLVDAIRAYNAKNKTHLTTEGSTSKGIYEAELSKSIGDFKDPKTGNVYDYVAVAKVQSPPPLAVGTMQYQWAGKCGAKSLEDTNDDTQSAIATLLENGSMYCLQI